jgi:hypothetical protein
MRAQREAEREADATNHADECAAPGDDYASLSGR